MASARLECICIILNRSLKVFGKYLLNKMSESLSLSVPQFSHVSSRIN